MTPRMDKLIFSVNIRLNCVWDTAKCYGARHFIFNALTCLPEKYILLKVTLMISVFAVQTVQFCQIITLRCQFLKISYVVSHVGGFLTKTPSQTI